jgi:hypothetical protein
MESEKKKIKDSDIGIKINQKLITGLKENG